MNRRIISLLEELKVMVQTSIILQQQQLANQSTGMSNVAVEEDFGLPLSAMAQLIKLESDCQDRDIRGRIVSLRRKIVFFFVRSCVFLDHFLKFHAHYMVATVVRAYNVVRPNSFDYRTLSVSLNCMAMAMTLFAQ